MTFYPGDAGEARATYARCGRRLDRRLVADEQRLDAAVAPVAHPAAQAVRKRLTLEPGAIADALDAAFDTQPHGLGHGGSGEFEDDLVDREAVADLGADLRHLAVALGAQDVLHLHRLHGGQRLAGLDLLPLGDGETDEEAWHR